MLDEGLPTILGSNLRQTLCRDGVFQRQIKAHLKPDQRQESRAVDRCFEVGQLVI
jgi:hypothetical protein